VKKRVRALRGETLVRQCAGARGETRFQGEVSVEAARELERGLRHRTNHFVLYERTQGGTTGYEN